MFNLLFVCTGNRCRSPFAQAYFARLVRDLPVEVFSAGTLDAPGGEVPKELIDIAHVSALDLSEHRSRVLAADPVTDIDLVIGFERAHVAIAVVDGNVPREIAFTLPELVRLLNEIEAPAGGDPIERARAALAAAAELRAAGPDFVPGEEVVDPFGGSRADYQASADELVALCDALFRGLFGEQSSRVAS